MKVYQALAQAVEGMNDERRADIMTEKIDTLMKGAPSGSGIDSSFRPEESNREKLVFSANYHHMNHGGWTYHRVVVTHDLLGLNVRVTGRNRNNVRNYLSDVYYQWLMEDVD